MPQSVTIATFAKHQTHTLLVLVEDEDSRRLRHAAVIARDRGDRGAIQPSSREAHTTCFPSPHLQTTKFNLRER